MSVLGVNLRGLTPGHVLLHKYDTTALSMSLAEGLINRYIRDIADSRAKMSDALKQHTSMTFGRFEKAYENLGALLSRCNTLVYSIRSPKTKHRAIYVVVLWEEGNFILKKIVIDKNGIFVGAYSLRISRHAAARMLFRNRCKELGEVFVEFLEISPRVNVALNQYKTPGDQFTVTSTSGLAVMKVLEGNWAICLTWIDDVLCRPEQYEESESIATVMHRLAATSEHPIIYAFGYNEQTARNHYRNYQRLGGEKEYDAFIRNVDDIMRTIEHED